MKTLAIITRVHPNRPNMLRACKESVSRQSCDDYEHLYIVDPKKQGSGRGWANKSFAIQPVNVDSKYVMVLDDDDMLIDKNLVEDIKTIAEKQDPDMFIFRGIIHNHRCPVLPPNNLWKRIIRGGLIASFCVAVKKEIWEAHKASFGADPRNGDFHFMKTAYIHADSIYWHDKVVAETQKGRNRGRGER